MRAARLRLVLPLQDAGLRGAAGRGARRRRDGAAAPRDRQRLGPPRDDRGARAVGALGRGRGARRGRRTPSTSCRARCSSCATGPPRCRPARRSGSTWSRRRSCGRPTCSTASALCSQDPLDETSYPHVPHSRAADFVLVRYQPRPADATGDALVGNREFQLYQLRPGLPGGDRCSQRMVQTVKRIERGQSCRRDARSPRDLQGLRHPRPVRRPDRRRHRRGDRPRVRARARRRSPASRRASCGSASGATCA